MTGTLVATKFFVPRPRGSLVPRARLAARLDAGADTALTLVSAPPGFGKTTVLSSWLAGPAMRDRVVAWVSLDDADVEAPTFWRYVVTALNSVLPEVGAAVMPQLASGQPVPVSLLATVLNDIASVVQEVELVLDDYHLADGVEVGEGMTYVLDHRPPNLHVVISTRADPRLPLSRLRVRGELVELRASDLRFTGDETAAYLAESHGLVVTDDDVAALESRTEGWAAALQLAVLSMQGRSDVGDFVKGFAGTDRHVVDYLVDEVLSRQPDDVRDFLLRSSVLDLLGGDLCDAVLERTGSRAMLESLDRANLFLVPMDAERRWHRYHRLFADVLQAHLRAEHPDLVVGLHARASRWYAAAGEPVPAVRHALAAGDVDRAADLIEEAMPGLRRRRQEATLRRWIDEIPADVVLRRPVLAVGFVGALMSCNEFGPAAELLRVVERALPAVRARLAGASPVDPGVGPAEPIVVLDEAELARVPAAVELYRAGLALVAGDLAGAQLHAGLTLETAVADDDLVRAGASGLSALASWADGDLDAACRSYTTCIEGLRRAQHVPDAIGCVLAVAEIHAAQGQAPRCARGVRRRHAAGRRVRGISRARRCGPSRGAQRGRRRTRRARRVHARASTRRALWVRRSACCATPTARGWSRRCSPRRRATSPARSCSCARPRGSTSATSHPTCARCTRWRCGCSCVSATSTRPTGGCASTASRRPIRCRTCASTST